jgi:hypothetical protein
MKKTFILLFIVLLAFSGCEKDDICAADTPTTPLLIIEFFDFDSNALKSVSKLKIQDSETLKLLGTYSETKIKLPLKTDSDSTKFIFTLNSETPAALNIDNLEFNYVRNSVYISRACGYKTLFLLNSNSPTKTDNVIPDTFWIKKITVTKPNILNEDETHIKIFL